MQLSLAGLATQRALRVVRTCCVPRVAVARAVPGSESCSYVGLALERIVGSQKFRAPAGRGDHRNRIDGRGSLAAARLMRRIRHVDITALTSRLLIASDSFG